jgi:hypothetical protein
MARRRRACAYICVVYRYCTVTSRPAPIICYHVTGRSANVYKNIIATELSIIIYVSIFTDESLSEQPHCHGHIESAEGEVICQFVWYML